MTDQDDRFCPKHYQPDTRHGFWNFGCDLRWGRRTCRYCEDEEYQDWIQDVSEELEMGLRFAAHGIKISWRPQPDSKEAIVARMAELENAPLTFEATVEWVRKYLGDDQT